MSRHVTLGGERLGAGKKMKVELHGFERSTHDLSYIWRSTMSAGTLVPFLKEVALPGDTFDIHLNCDIKTHPTVGPLFGSYKVQLDVFSAPVRLYHSALHNNRLGIGLNMSQIKLPYMNLTATPIDILEVQDIDNAQTNPSSILAHLDMRGVGYLMDPEEPDNIRAFNAVPYLMYWDTYKNYYANKQEEIGYVVSIWPTFNNPGSVSTVEVGAFLITQGGGSSAPLIAGQTVSFNYTISPPNAQAIYIMTNLGNLSLYELATGNNVVDTGTSLDAIYDVAKFGVRVAQGWDYLQPGQVLTIPPQLVSFPLDNIDLMRDAILQSPWNVAFNIGLDPLPPYSYAIGTIPLVGGDVAMAAISSQEGLGIKCYQSDLFNNWLSTEWIDGTGGINEITAIDTSGGSFNIDTLNLSKKVYDMLNRIAVSGGSYNDWIEAVYDQDPFRGTESPVYHGGLIKELVFQEVVSNSAADVSGTQPLGTLAGKGTMGGKHKGGTVVIKVSEPSYIMGIISLTPRVDYSQGNKWDVHLQTMDDFHKPNLDQIGFQELIIEQMGWWTTYLPAGGAVNWEQASAGKQPAWINYMTNVNKVRGNFAIKDNEMFMTLNRRYEAGLRLDDTLSIKDLTTYIDPTKYNHIFAETALDAQNFWTQVSVDMIARRKMSAKVMPNL